MSKPDWKVSIVATFSLAGVSAIGAAAVGGLAGCSSSASGRRDARRGDWVQQGNGTPDRRHGWRRALGGLRALQGGHQAGDLRQTTVLGR